MKRTALLSIPVLVLVVVAWNSRPSSPDAAPRKNRASRSARPPLEAGVPEENGGAPVEPVRKSPVAGKTGPTDGPANSVVHVSLKWLLDHQKENGSWEAGFARVDGHVIDEVGETALAVLSFLGAGYCHLTKEEMGGHVVGVRIRAALDYLMKMQGPDGIFRTNGDGPLTQALAALAISEAFGMTGSRMFADPASRAIAALGGIQAEDGSWGTLPRNGWATAAMKSAQLSDVAVDGTVMDRSKTRVATVMNPSADARIVLEEILLNKRRSDSMASSCAALADRAADATRPNLGEWYFTSLALFQYDGPSGELWKKWNLGFRDALLALGGRECVVASDSPAQSVVDTALMTLCFEVYYRYGPVGK